ncbi:VOC family protein [Pontivivens insulae]|uniref:PhnB-like domain-containing protein n=1 Tax=Pontivivens insulae TaxID=1639689 RepID=A0A2R8ADY1_9RHOB|nr:VOC family protein [Pontivivens insulae]RED14190.1 putative 3-demethylubiquinone-9 3-methyltransferase (glyoxalase superfamily) [Pontivivens insulae]SPF30265.1 hypothetical protein POI8812_02601 [Pontivivens insulae]
MNTSGKAGLCLWFDGQAEEVADFYMALFEDGHVISRNRSPIDWPGGAAGDVVLVEFEMAGMRLQALNGGPDRPHTDAASLTISATDQDEVDRLWGAILAAGGEEIMCGWIKDRWGVRWQIVPAEFEEMRRSAPTEALARGYAAMMTMRKLDMSQLREAVLTG